MQSLEIIAVLGAVSAFILVVLCTDGTVLPVWWRVLVGVILPTVVVGTVLVGRYYGREK